MPPIGLVKLSALVIFLPLMLTAAACGAAAAPTVVATPEPTPAFASTPSPTIALEADGKQLFVEKGCAACHGQNAEGSAIAPALPGHTAEQVRRQVRNPIGSMPRFGPEKINDEELEKLIEFISELKSDGHGEPLDLSMGDVITMHHWMAILALKADRVTEAKHHVKHIIGLVEDAEHRRQMEVVLDALEENHLHDAEHAVEGMLAGTAEPELSLGELHLQMVLSALAVDDAEDARHHLDHFMEEAEPSQVDLAEEVRGHLNAGELHEAGQLAKEIIEDMPHRHHQHDN